MNVQCFDDSNCFQYYVLAGMNLIKSSYHGHKCRPSQYKPFLNMLSMDGIQNPVPVADSLLKWLSKQGVFAHGYADDGVVLVCGNP